MNDKLTAAGLALAAAVPLVVPLLWWGFRPPSGGRPRWYRGKRRAPGWFRRWRQRRAGHVGATPDWSPAAEIEAVDAVEPALTVADLDAEAEVIVEHQHRDEDAIEDEVHRMFATVDDLIIGFRMRWHAGQAPYQRQPDPVCVDRGAARDRQAWAEETGQWSTAELHQLLDRDGLVPA